MAYISKLKLYNFRNHISFEEDICNNPVILCGENGVGKTNILESISMLSPGKGLRNADIAELNHQGEYLWQINACVSAEKPTEIDIYNNNGKKQIQIDGKATKTQGELAEYLGVIWVTPLMDQLFIGPASERRRFLDRLVYHFDPAHAKRVLAYEKYMRERLKLLKENIRDDIWLFVLEKNMAENGVAIATSRMEIVGIIRKFLDSQVSSFPKAIISVDGYLENILARKNALQAEEEFIDKLGKSRNFDRESGRTNFGAHKSDMKLVHDGKNQPAALCSTGEQKALLFSVIIAEARARKEWKEDPPIILLDEVVAHLDEYKRAALFDEIKALKIQAWMSGTDKNMFKMIEKDSLILELQ